MKDLNRNEVYDLRGITHEQAEELLQWLIENDKEWLSDNIDDFKNNNAMYFDHEFWNEWLITSFIETEPTTHISTLFEEPSYEDQLIEAVKRVEELKRKINEPKVGDWVFLKDRGFKIVTNKNQANGLFKQGWKKVTNPITVDMLNRYGAN